MHMYWSWIWVFNLFTHWVKMKDYLLFSPVNLMTGWQSQKLLDGFPWNFVHNIHGPQRMNPADFRDLFNKRRHQVKVFTNPVKYFNIYWIGWHKLWYRHSWFADFSSSTNMRFTFVVFSEIFAQPLLDGLAWNVVHVFMFLSGWIVISWTWTQWMFSLAPSSMLPLCMLAGWH